MKAIVTKYHGPTNTKGSRITASDSDGNKITKTIAFLEDEARTRGIHVGMPGDGLHRLAAEHLCKKMRWSGAETLVEGYLANAHVFVFNTLDQR